MTPREKRLSKDANMRLWRIFYYDYFDYPKCFEYLAQAREIADEAGIEDANIYIGLGCMYQTISEETDNFELGTQALDYYIMALDAGLRTADDLHTDMACTDVLSMASIQHGIPSVEAQWQRYSQLPETGPTAWLRRYNKLLHEAYTLLDRQRYDDAIGVFDRQLQLIDTTAYRRLVYFTCVERAKVYAKKGDFIEAVSQLRRPEHIAVSLGMKDMQLEVFELLAQFYEQAGEQLPATLGVIEGSAQAFPAFILHHLPAWLGGIMLGTLLINIIGCGSGLSLGAATILVRDVYSNLPARISPSNHIGGQLAQTRLTIVGLLLVAVGAALLMIDGTFINDLGFLSLGLRAVAILFPLSFALWLPGRFSQRAVLLSMLLGTVAMLLAKLWTLPGDAVYYGLGVALTPMFLPARHAHAS